MREKFDKGKADNNIEQCINAADGLLLIGAMVEQNVGKMTLKFGDFTHNGKPEGDWEIRVRQFLAQSRKTAKSEGWREPLYDLVFSSCQRLRSEVLGGNRHKPLCGAT